MTYFSDHASFIYMGSGVWLFHLSTAAWALGLISFLILTFSKAGLSNLNALSIPSDNSEGCSISSPCPPSAFTTWSYRDGSKSVATDLPKTPIWICLSIPHAESSRHRARCPKSPATQELSRQRGQLCQWKCSRHLTQREACFGGLLWGRQLT